MAACSRSNPPTALSCHHMIRRTFLLFLTAALSVPCYHRQQARWIIATSSRCARATEWWSAFIISPPMLALILARWRQRRGRSRRYRLCPGRGSSGSRQFGRWRLFVVAHHDGKTTFIDFREKAPLQATETMYQDASGSVIPTQLLGYRSIATPGSVAGLVYAERKYGKLGLWRVIAQPSC